jgi:histidinol-phosphate phosphatase family protein
MMQIDNSWTLFLDRDGVINYEKEADYINHRDEFRFYEGVPEAIAALSTLFGKIIVVTNQKGVGKGVTPLAELHEMHRLMTEAIQQAGGRIDAIFFCPDLNDDSPRRKPNPGMAYDAVAQFPNIVLAKSLMVGNKLSDLHFGRAAGTKTAFLRTTHPNTVVPPGLADLEADSLPQLAHILLNPA